MSSTYTFSLSIITSGNIKKDQLFSEILVAIPSPVLTDIAIYGSFLQCIFPSALTGPQQTTLQTTITNHSPNSNIYTEEYYIKVSEADTQANVLASTLVNSNNIRYSIVNPGADETYRAFVNTSDGVIGTDVIWSSSYINSQLYKVKVTESDSVANYLSSSLFSSNNSITFSVNGAAGTDQKLIANIADPLTISRLTLTSDLFVNNISGINGTDVNISSYLQYKNRGIIMNSSIPVPSSTGLNSIIKFNGIIVNNNMSYNGSDITVNNLGFYNIGAQCVYNGGNANDNCGIRIFKNRNLTRPIGSTFGRLATGQSTGVLNISILDYASDTTAVYTLYGYNLSNTTVNFGILSNDAENRFTCVYLGY